MKAEHYRRMWTVVGLALLYCSINHYSFVQGGPVLFEFMLLNANPLEAAYLALFLCLLMLILLCSIGLWHADANRALD